MKKICIIYANCQNELLAEYLLKSPSFNQEYTIKRFPVHLLMQGKKTIPDELLKRAKLFIYQPVKDIHGICSSRYILNKLPSDCQRISFPPLYFTGYHPQYCKNPVNKVIKPIYPFGVMPYGDSNIISMLKQSNSVSEIIERLSNTNYYSQQFLLANVDKSLAELSRREAVLNIKVSDFIKKNYQHYYLFYTVNHPTDIMGIYVVNQILKALDLPLLDRETYIKDSTTGILDEEQTPIYPSVIKKLSLTFINENAVYKHGKFCTNKMTFARYIDEYVNLHSSTSESAIHHYFEGIKYLKQRKLKQAEHSIKKAIEKKANNATYYRELGAVFEQQNKLDRAELAYRKAIEVSPDWADFYVLLGKVLVNKNHKKAAVCVYQQALNLDPVNDEIYHLLGDIMMELKNLDSAENFYQEAIRLKPLTAIYHRCLGDVFQQRGELDLASIAYRKGLEIYPKNAWLHINISKVLAEQNRLDDAISVCKQSIKLEPKNSHFYRELGNIQLQKGDIDRAFKTYQKAVELNSNQVEKIFQNISLLMKDRAVFSRV